MKKPPPARTALSSAGRDMLSPRTGPSPKAGDGGAQPKRSAAEQGAGSRPNGSGMGAVGGGGPGPMLSVSIRGAGGEVNQSGGKPLGTMSSRGNAVLGGAGESPSKAAGPRGSRSSAVNGPSLSIGPGGPVGASQVPAVMPAAAAPASEKVPMPPAGKGDSSLAVKADAMAATKVDSEKADAKAATKADSAPAKANPAPIAAPVAEAPVAASNAAQLEAAQIAKIHSAIRWNKSTEEILAVLEEVGADMAGAVAAADPKNGNRALHIAAQNGHMDLLKCS
mmetsp:Transcript_11192/g.28882  ORF Transcript_11192/g.28882 Transcript_11192/m.28882 type:complete len:280 (+) Transcript_11192:67-906(+)